MSYCVNPSCPHPKNPNDVQICQACSGKLRLNGRYQVLGLLGKGGFGATFAAADIGLPGTPICVVKQLRPATDDPNVFRMAKELFEREAQTLGKVGVHPQVPRLLDYFEEDQQFYLVQEYVKGHNLHQEVKKHGPYSEEGTKQFLTELLPILTYIHSQKVIHRDIKPANLIRRQTDSKLVLIDFGAVKNEVNSVLASNTSAQSALTAFAVGTAGFAPPEQMAMRPVYASDIYAVGITCLYLLTGKTPKEMDCNHQTGEIDWEKYVTVGESFAKVIKTMLELSVRHRYKSAQQVLDAMDTLPYEEGMRQGLISAPISPAGTDSSASTSFRSPSQEPATRFGRNNPSTSFSSGMQTGIKTRTHSTNLNPAPETTRLSPNPPRKPTPNRDAPPRPAANAGMDFNVALKGSPKKDRRSVDTVVQNQNIQWNNKSLLGAYEKGHRDFADQDLQGITLLKSFIPTINCYQSNLTRANFQGTDLTRADFGKAILSQANLKETNLTDAYFGYANLEGADLRGANLRGANFKYANIRGANFCGTDLSSTQISADQLATAKTNWRTVMPNGKRGW